MILYELLGKPPYVPKKAKSQKSPVPPQKKSDYMNYVSRVVWLKDGELSMEYNQEKDKKNSKIKG